MHAESVCIYCHVCGPQTFCDLMTFTLANGQESSLKQILHQEDYKGTCLLSYLNPKIVGNKWMPFKKIKSHQMSVRLFTLITKHLGCL